MPQTIEDPELETNKTYHKSIDALIEDAEIEAEIEAEKHIRSKNTRLFTISLVAIALIGTIYWQVSETTIQKESNEAALPELTEAQSTEEIAVQAPEPAPSPPQEPEPSPATKIEPEATTANPVAPVEKVAKSITPEALPKETVPQIAKAVVPQPIQTPKEPVITKALPKEPAPEIAKAEVSQPAQTPKVEATPVTKQYFVQLGSFSIEDNAKSFIGQLKKKGFNPSILTKSGRATKHVVFVGGFSTEESGSQALKDLKSKGFKSVMEKLDDNSYTIVLGKFTTSGKAEALRDKLSLAGFLSSSRTKEVSSTIFIVQLGGYDGLGQAKVAQKKVGGAGFNDSFIR